MPNLLPETARQEQERECPQPWTAVASKVAPERAWIRDAKGADVVCVTTYRDNVSALEVAERAVQANALRADRDSLAAENRELRAERDALAKVAEEAFPYLPVSDHGHKQGCEVRHFCGAAADAKPCTCGVRPGAKLRARILVLLARRAERQGETDV